MWVSISSVPTVQSDGCLYVSIPLHCAGLPIYAPDLPHTEHQGNMQACEPTIHFFRRHLLKFPVCQGCVVTAPDLGPRGAHLLVTDWKLLSIYRNPLATRGSPDPGVLGRGGGRKRLNPGPDFTEVPVAPHAKPHHCLHRLRAQLLVFHETSTESAKNEFVFVRSLSRHDTLKSAWDLASERLDYAASVALTCWETWGKFPHL